MSILSPITDIIADIRLGKMVILVDEEDRENEGDLVMASQFVTPEAINFMAKYGRGLICMTMTRDRCEQLGLELMVRDNRSPHKTAFTLSIEAAEGVTTGISAHDRARTVQAAVARHAKPSDIVQPGHIFPLMAQDGGVLVRAGHTEAGCDLGALAGVEPSAVICEIMNDDGTMARMPDLEVFAQEHGLKIGAIRDLIHYRAASEQLIQKIACKPVNTAFGEFNLCAFSDTTSGDVHLALTRGDITQERETLVRVHETASILDFIGAGSVRHTFSAEDSLRRIAEHGQGVLVLLHPGQGAKSLLDVLGEGQSAENRQPVKWDVHSFGIGAQILRALNVGKMRLLASPRKIPSMAGFGLEICGYADKA